MTATIPRKEPSHADDFRLRVGIWDLGFCSAIGIWIFGLGSTSDWDFDFGLGLGFGIWDLNGLGIAFSDWGLLGWYFGFVVSELTIREMFPKPGVYGNELIMQLRISPSGNLEGC
jgi:hypothetical protein